MEPSKQIEIQLGHLCNNRCVFCVSGQETALGRALPVPIEPVLERLRQAAADGHKKLTLLGGEPTLQPGFLSVLRLAVELGFEQIVVFTNGAKTARAGYVEELIAIAGSRLVWRLSLQGATREAHERTTRKPGSFARLEATMEHLRARHQHLTVNMCVVRSNYASISAFPRLLERYGARQLHLDMVRPMDAGQRTEEEYADMLPRYSDLAAPLREMIAGFPEGFDVNIGNLPYCIAPELAPYIHHDGELTETVAADGDGLSRPWDKYFVKRRDKFKPESCQRCVFYERCSGVFEKYEQLYGLTELQPVSAAALRAVDPRGRLLALQLRPVTERLRAWTPPSPFEEARVWEASDRELLLELRAAEQGLRLRLTAPGGGVAGFEHFSVHVVTAPPSAALTQRGLSALVDALQGWGEALVHPPGADAVAGGVARSIAARLGRLRARAPFTGLIWERLEVSGDGARAELSFKSTDGGAAVLWLSEAQRQASGGYRVLSEATPALVAGLGSVLQALRATPAAAREPLSSAQK